MNTFRQHTIDSKFDNLSVRSFATIKGEFNSGLRFHVHLGSATKTIEGYPCQYCAVFYLGAFDNINPYLFRQGGFNQGISCISGHLEGLNITNKENNLDETMFIGIINIPEKRQRSIPCLIRLQALDSCPLNICQSADIFGGLFFEETITIPNREFDVFSEQRVFDDIELPKQVIKRRSHIVTGIANKQGKFRRNGFSLLKPEQALSCLSLSYKFSDGSIRLTLQEPLHQVIDDLEVFVSSAEFEENTIERMHMLYSDYGRKEHGDTKNTTRVRDTRTQEKGRVRRTRKGGETDQAPSSPPPPEEVKSQTETNHRSGGYTAKHTRLGSPEDV